MDAQARMSPGPDGPQHLQALRRANAVRLARADLKRRVADGDVSAAEVILRSPWEAGSMTGADRVTRQRRWGRTRCRELWQYLSIPENKRIGSMTDRQRRVLAALLNESESSCRPAATAVETERSEPLQPVLAGAACPGVARACPTRRFVCRVAQPGDAAHARSLIRGSRC